MNCHLRTLVPLMVSYLVLSANLAWNNLLLGAALALGVSALLPWGKGERECRGILAALPAILQYAVILGFDLIRSGIQVARIVLTPEMPIRPGILPVPSECRSDLGRALSAHAVTLTPGQLVVGMDDDGVMYTHCLDVTGALESLSRAQKVRERLLHRIFLSPP